MYATFIRDLDLAWDKHRLQPEREADEDLAAWPVQLGLSVLSDGQAAEVTDAQLATAREKLKQVTNPIGRKWLEDSSLESKRIHELGLSSQARYEGTRLFVALRLSELRQGGLPTNLETVVKSQIIKQLPLDPFSGQPFGYARDARALWSVGPNGNVSPQVPADDPDTGRYFWRFGPPPASSDVPSARSWSGLSATLVIAKSGSRPRILQSLD